MAWTDLIRPALEAAGYDHLAPTAEHLVECFHDYVSDGAWRNLFYEEGAVFTEDGEEIKDYRLMAKALIRLGARFR